jgi:hypothetical protein
MKVYSAFTVEPFFDIHLIADSVEHAREIVDKRLEQLWLEEPIEYEIELVSFQYGIFAESFEDEL